MNAKKGAYHCGNDGFATNDSYPSRHPTLWIQSWRTTSPNASGG